MLQGLACYIEQAACHPVEIDFPRFLPTDDTGEHGTGADEVMPERFAARPPYFCTVQQQEAAMAKLQETVDQRLYFLRKVVPRTRLRRCFRSVMSLVLTGTGLVFAFGFWKVWTANMQMRRQRKAEKNSADLGKCFIAWQILLDRSHEERQQAALHELRADRDQLKANLKQVYFYQQVVGQELAQQQKEVAKLEHLLQDRQAKCRALSERFEQAQPKLVASMLRSLLDETLPKALLEARCYPHLVRQRLKSQDLAVLLAQEEDDLERLAGLSCENLILRWVNYHLMQYKRLAAEVLEGPSRKPNAKFKAGRQWRGQPTRRELSRHGPDGERCRAVRGLHRLASLSEDTCEEITGALSVLIGAVVSPAHAPSAAALCLLDHKDVDVQVAKICEALSSLLPTRAARCLLHPSDITLLPSDITRGNVKALVMALAALFLDRPRLPSFSWQVASLERGGSPEGSKMVDPEEEAVEAARAAAAATPGSAVGRDPSAVDQLVLNLELAASSCSYDSMQDLTLLMEGDDVRVPRDLVRLHPGKLLLRWLNHHIQRRGCAPVEQFEELQNGVVLLQLLEAVAGDALDLASSMSAAARAEASEWSHEAKEVKEGDVPDTDGAEAKEGNDGEPPGAAGVEVLLEAVVEAGFRCTGMLLLSRATLDHGQPDVLAAFLAAMFLSRPGMALVPGSTLEGHQQHIQLLSSQGSQSAVRLQGRCLLLKENRESFTKACAAICSADELQKEVSRRVFDFLKNLLTQRALGTPCTALGLESKDAKGEAAEERRARCLLTKRIDALFVLEADGERQSLAVWDLIRKNSLLFRRMFQYYSSEGGDGAAAAAVGAAEEQQQAPRPGQGRGVPRGSVLRPPPPPEQNLNRRRRGLLQSHQTDHLKVSLWSRTGTDAETGSLLELRGLMRMFEDCQLRALGLQPMDMEVIFRRVAASQQRRSRGSGSGSGAKGQDPKALQDKHIGGLTIGAFLEALVIIGCQIKSPELSSDSTCVERVSYLVEKRFWPLSMRPNRAIFYSLLYHKGLGQILARYDDALKVVFRRYADQDPKTDTTRCFGGTVGQDEVAPRAVQQRGATGTAADSKSRARQQRGEPVYGMSAAGLHDMMTDSGLLTGALTGHAVWQIVWGLQHGFKDEEAQQVEQSSEGDDAEDEDESSASSLESSPAMSSMLSRSSSKRSRISTGSLLQQPGARRSGCSATSIALEDRPQSTLSTESSKRGQEDRPRSTISASRKSDPGLSAGNRRGTVKVPLSSRRPSSRRPSGAPASLPQNLITLPPICFQEFIGALVAATLYKDPNPFMPFLQRFEALLERGILRPLRERWTRQQLTNPITAPYLKALDSCLMDMDRKSGRFKGAYGAWKAAAPRNQVKTAAAG